MKTTHHKFPFKWYARDGYPAPDIESHGRKVFGTFIGAGGSSMGYKLAGFDHLGGVEWDRRQAKMYDLNLQPKYLYVEDLREFNRRDDLPDELYELDILDGSPPCSTFSLAGDREGAWGILKKFREGQSEQELDDLVFVYSQTIDKLRPKVAWFENVHGMLIGNARSYLRQLWDLWEQMGYRTQVFTLNAAVMGVPQARRRVFMLGLRDDIVRPPLELKFNEPMIPYRQWIDDDDRGHPTPMSDFKREVWERVEWGDPCSTGHPKGHWFNAHKMHPARVSKTMAANGNGFFCHDTPRFLTAGEMCSLSTFPQDYVFLGAGDKIDYRWYYTAYATGMSVPPVMVAQISHQVFQQWLK